MDNKKFVGIPFEHNGRDFNGVDCIGLVELYLNEHGINLVAQDGKEINKEWYLENPKRLLQGVKRRGNKIDFNNRSKFDIAVFEFRGIASHIGVMVNRNEFLHNFEERKSGISNINRWKNKLAGLYRIGDK